MFRILILSKSAAFDSHVIGGPGCGGQEREPNAESVMSVKSIFWGVVAVALAGAAYAIYAPDQVQSFSPRAAELARAARAHLPLSAAEAAPPQRAAAPAATPVEAETVGRRDFPVTLESLGQVAPYKTVTVGPRVDGQIDKIAFKEGQMVRQGDLLAEIDPQPFQAALDQAKAKKTQDEANLANAKLDLQRYSTLAKQSFATQQQLDTQNALVNSNIAQIAADAAAIEAAQVQLDYTTIRAPLAGRAGFRLVDRATWSPPRQQTGIVAIAQLQPISVIFTAPEEEVGAINALMHAGDAEGRGQNLRRQQAAGDRQAERGRQSGRHHDGHDPPEGPSSPNKDNKLWPGLAVIDATDARRGQGRRCRADGGDPARRRTAFSSMSSTMRTASALRPVKIAARGYRTRRSIDKGVNEGDGGDRRAICAAAGRARGGRHSRCAGS